MIICIKSCTLYIIIMNYLYQIYLDILSLSHFNLLKCNFLRKAKHMENISIFILFIHVRKKNILMIYKMFIYMLHLIYYKHYKLF